MSLLSLRRIALKTGSLLDDGSIFLGTIDDKTKEQKTTLPRGFLEVFSSKPIATHLKIRPNRLRLLAAGKQFMKLDVQLVLFDKICA